MDRIAKALLEEIQALVSDSNIKIIERVLHLVDARADERWEAWLTKDTNEILTFDRFSCECGRKVMIERGKDKLYTTLVDRTKNKKVC